MDREKQRLFNRLFERDAPRSRTEKIIGVVWGFTSHEAARDALRVINTIAYRLNPGALLKDSGMIPASDAEGYYVVLIGTGDNESDLVFDISFLTVVGTVIHQYHGNRLPESPRIKKIIRDTERQWRKKQKQSRRETRN